MIKKQSVLAFILILLIPLVSVLGGTLSNLINPEIAAGHPNYVRNFHLLSLLKTSILLASFGGVVVLWVAACLLVIRSKRRSETWLVLAVFGPIGFAVLATLKDRDAAQTDRYSLFVGRMKWIVRGAYEICAFVILWELAWQAMILNRELIIRYEAITQGVSTQQIIDTQNASSGMWAFGEGIEEMYLVALFYVLRPIVFCLIADFVAKRSLPKAV